MYQAWKRVLGQTQMTGAGFVVPASAGSDFITDTFTEGSDQLIQDHTGELGATWTQHPHVNYSGNSMLVDAASDRVYNTSGTDAAYASGVPPSADYYVQADFHCHTTTSNVGIALRMDTTDDTMYYVRWNSTVWELRRILSTAQLTIGSSSNQLLTAGNSKTVKLIVSGSDLTVQINGVTEIGPINDTNISSAGRAGIRMVTVQTSTTGVHIDNFSAR